jgi:hypothetical protein
VRTRVVDAINRFVGDPPIGDVIKLQRRVAASRRRLAHSHAARQRTATVVVLRVLPRGRAYRD